MLENEKHTDNMLNDAFKMEPRFNLPDGFAEIVAAKVGKRMVLNQYLKEFLIFSVAIAGIIAIAVGIMFFFNAKTWFSWVDILKSNLVVVLGIIFISLFILFTDKVLLRYFHHQVSTRKIS